MRKANDLTGKKFGSLTVIERAEKPAHIQSNRPYWSCKCDCGETTIIRGSSLLHNETTSCGCAKRGAKEKHGMSQTRFYNIWYRMVRRCEDENSNEYHNYGGRGITVCEEWKSFEKFAYDMHDSYIEFEVEHGIDTASIERVGYNGDYCKDNCRWATDLEQARNRRGNVRIEVDSVEYATLTELAEAYNLPYITVYQRYTNGKRGEELIKPVTKQNPRKGTQRGGIKVEVDGIYYSSLSALQKEYPHVSLVTISKRYKQGKRGLELVAQRYS
jgi:hypothetical protein